MPWIGFCLTGMLAVWTAAAGWVQQGCTLPEAGLDPRPSPTRAGPALHVKQAAAISCIFRSRHDTFRAAGDSVKHRFEAISLAMIGPDSARFAHQWRQQKSRVRVAPPSFGRNPGDNNVELHASPNLMESLDLIDFSCTLRV